MISSREVGDQIAAGSVASGEALERLAEATASSTIA